MTPTHEQYWDAIVGDQWPAFGPSEWLRLAAVARDGAAALDVDGVVRAVDGFDATVRSSAGLRAALADMRAHQDMPRRLASALGAAADTFDDLADLVRGTCNRISDIVDRAVERIDAVGGDDNGGPARQLVSTIVATARTDVIDVVTEAARRVGSSGLSGLRDVAGLLGPGLAGDELSATTAPPDVDALSLRGPDDPTFGSPVPAHRVSDPAEVAAPKSEATNHSGEQELSPQTMPPAMSGRVAVPEPAAVMDDNDPAVSPGGTHAGDVSRASGRPGSVVAGGPAPESVADPDPGDPVAVQPVSIAGPDEASSAFDVVGEQATAPGVFMPGIAGPVVAPFAAPGERRATAIGTQYSAPQRPSRVAATPATETPRPRITVRPAPAPGVAATADPKASAPVARPLPMSDARGRDEDQQAGGSAHAAGSRSEVGGQPAPDRDRLGEVVRAAMISTGSGHVVGDRVDGDLVLARSLLAGILDVAPPLADWAVATMRHAAGITVLVTCNEGAGYLPARLYLPPQVSRPWGWKMPEETIWEGLSDPARVLAEFGAVRARRSGARLSALASSLPVAPGLRRELPDLPLEGEVAAASGLDLGSPGPGRVDRLGLTSSSSLTRRIDAVPDSAIIDRCERMAMAAHAGSLAQEQNRALTLDAPALRDRILRAWRDGARIDEQWWQVLREVDDLLAATMLTEKLDVSRIPLGELRADRSARAEPARLRRMVLERRCDELVLGLAEAPTRQSLRDTVYAYAQIVRNRPELRDGATVTPG
ncbi:hypothetical protein [Nocardia brasiliensis]